MLAARHVCPPALRPIPNTCEACCEGYGRPQKCHNGTGCSTFHGFWTCTLVTVHCLKPAWALLD